jgi:hypothetical protein
MLKQKIRSLSLCFVSLHIFCWINPENVEHICHILNCVWMRFSWNLRIISEKWLCFTVNFFEPGEVINSSGLPTQRSLFVTSLNLRIRYVYSGSEQNSFRLFVNFVISTDLYCINRRILLFLVTCLVICVTFQGVSVVTGKCRELQWKYAWMDCRVLCTPRNVHSPTLLSTVFYFILL